MEWIGSIVIKEVLLETDLRKVVRKWPANSPYAFNRRQGSGLSSGLDQRIPGFVKEITGLGRCPDC